MTNNTRTGGVVLILWLSLASWRAHQNWGCAGHLPHAMASGPCAGFAWALACRVTDE